jgi:hypothetical protein
MTQGSLAPSSTSCPSLRSPATVFTGSLRLLSLGDNELDLRAPTSHHRPRKYYAVAAGRRLGIFKSWAECHDSVDRFAHAKHKSFVSRSQATIWLEKHNVLLSASGRWHTSAPNPGPAMAQLHRRPTGSSGGAGGVVEVETLAAAAAAVIVAPLPVPHAVASTLPVTPRTAPPTRHEAGGRIGAVDATAATQVGVTPRADDTVGLGARRRI